MQSLYLSGVWCVLWPVTTTLSTCREKYTASFEIISERVDGVDRDAVKSRRALLPRTSSILVVAQWIDLFLYLFCLFSPFRAGR